MYFNRKILTKKYFYFMELLPFCHSEYLFLLGVIARRYDVAISCGSNNKREYYMKSCYFEEIATLHCVTLAMTVRMGA